MNTHTAEQRQAIRSTFRQRRNSLSLLQQQQASRELVSQASKHHIFTNKQRIAIYLTNDGELCTQALIQHLWDRHIEVYLPVLHPFSKGHLVFLRYNSTTPMRNNRFGIAEPLLNVSNLCPVSQLDIIFTPLVAFDEQGNRLGMGGGFYDRTLAQLQNCAQPNIIGLAHDVQKTLSLPKETWDIPLPRILTPSQLYSFTETNT
ncbi:MAG: 5-formyltetrahydrofolate cyclo-ligase [Glaciecola sp.]